MKYLGIFIMFVLTLSAFGQRKSGHLYISGTVLGYHYEPKKFFRKEQVEIQGSLSGVKLTVKGSGNAEISSAKSDNGGSFGLYVPLNQKVTLTYSKSGYARSSINFDISSVPDDMQRTGLILENIELILNDNQTEYPIDNGTPFANVDYGSSKVFSVTPVEFDKRDRLFKEIENSTPVNLLTRSVKKNRNKNLKATEVEVVDENTDNGNTSNRDTPENTDKNTTDEVTETKSSLEKKLNILKKTNLEEVDKWKELSPEDLDSRAEEINAAWEQLEKDKLLAVTEEDFLIIEAKEELLRSAERELEAAKAYIDEQEGKLNAQRNFMIVLIIMIILMGTFVFYLIKSIRDKNRLNKELDAKNQRILASIGYAKRIQRSVLLRDDEIKAILPKSFVIYEPLDVVSGDFYWFTEVNGKAIVAAVDCTGHGVPGAFMSLIGNTLMNQIINENKITTPSKILSELHKGIVKSLNQEEDDEASQDGMDMSICTIDKSTGEVVFAGAGNPVYVVQNGEATELSADIRGVGGVLSKKKSRTFQYNDRTIKLAKGSSIYLFSDGYMDQFGGKKNEKFNIPRFKELIESVHQDSMEVQRDKMLQAFQDWKGNTNQVDDVLVIGVQI